MKRTVTEFLENIDYIEQARNEFIKKQRNLEIRELELSKMENDVYRREVEVKEKEDAISKKEEDINKMKNELKSREIIMQQNVKQISNKQKILDKIHFEISNDSYYSLDHSGNYKNQKERALIACAKGYIGFLTKILKTEIVRIKRNTNRFTRRLHIEQVYIPLFDLCYEKLAGGVHMAEKEKQKAIEWAIAYVDSM